MDSEFLLEVPAEDLQQFPDPIDNSTALECTPPIQQNPPQTENNSSTLKQDTSPILSLLSLNIPTPKHLVHATSVEVEIILLIETAVSGLGWTQVDLVERMKCNGTSSSPGVKAIRSLGPSGRSCHCYDKLLKRSHYHQKRWQKQRGDRAIRNSLQKENPTPHLQRPSRRKTRSPHPESKGLDGSNRHNKGPR